jgi:hypothetical protein
VLVVATRFRFSSALPNFMTRKGWREKSRSGICFSHLVAFALRGEITRNRRRGGRE